MIKFATMKFRLPKYINRTLSVRLSLMVVSAMAILLMASLIVMLHFSRKAVKEEAILKASQTLEGTMLRLDNVLLSVEQASGNIYYSLQPHLDQPDKIHTSCRKLVESNRFIVGCAIAFKPYYFKDQELFLSYFRHTEGGLNGPESPVIQENTFGNSPYTEQTWFTETMSSNKPDWRSPLQGLDVDMEPIVSFCLPISDANRTTLGVMRVDVSLSLLSHIVLEGKPSPNSYCTLLEDDGSFIVHPDSNKLLHQFTETHQEVDPAMKEAAKAMVSGETGYRPFKMNHADYYIFYAPFKRAAVQGRSMEYLGWSIGIIYPEDDIFGDYNRLLYNVLAIATIGLLLLYVFSRVVIHRQLLPLRLLTKSAQHIANGNYNEIIPDSQQHDEIGDLQNHFQQMQQSLATNVGELEQLTVTLEKQGKELRAAYEQAQQADHMKTAFLHNMTDQMIGPAAAISHDVDELCDFNSSKSKEETIRLADDIQHQGKTITELLNNLLHVSEEETGKEGDHD